MASGRVPCFVDLQTIPSLRRRIVNPHLAWITWIKKYTVDDKSIKLRFWDIGGMERVASSHPVTISFAEGAILVFALDNASSFHSLSQHLLDIVTYAENAKIFICGNKSHLDGREPQVSDAEMEAFCEQCHGLISATYKTSCKTGKGVEEMFRDISKILVDANRSKMELQAMEQHGFKIDHPDEPPEDDGNCIC